MPMPGGCTCPHPVLQVPTAGGSMCLLLGAVRSRCTFPRLGLRVPAARGSRHLHLGT